MLASYAAANGLPSDSRAGLLGNAVSRALPERPGARLVYTSRRMFAIRPFIALLSLLVAASGGATTIYKSVDAQGRVTFSDQQPPATELVAVLEYREPATTRTALDTERSEALRAVTDRMAADRREREALRAGARAARQEPRASSTAGSGNATPAVYYGHYPVYYPGHYRPPGARPGRRAVETRPYAARPNAARPNAARPNAARPNAARPNAARPDAARPATAPAHGAASTTGFNDYPASLIRKHYRGAARHVFYRAPFIGR